MDKVSAIFNGSLDYRIANGGYISPWSAYYPFSDEYLFSVLLHATKYGSNMKRLNILSENRGKDLKKLEEDVVKCFALTLLGNSSVEPLHSTCFEGPH